MMKTWKRLSLILAVGLLGLNLAVALARNHRSSLLLQPCEFQSQYWLGAFPLRLTRASTLVSDRDASNGS